MCMCVHVYRFSDRVLIPNPKTRRVLLTYAKNGLHSMEMDELIKLTNAYAPFLVELITFSD